jgi:multidrug efflux pump subunit AcrB
MSNIKATVNIMLSGEDLRVLDSVGEKVLKGLEGITGLKSVERSWDYDKESSLLEIDSDTALVYSLSPQDIVAQLSLYLKGVSVSSYLPPNRNPVPVRLVLPPEARQSLSQLEGYYIDTPKGKAPLSLFISLRMELEPTLITRQDMKYTLEILGYREKGAVSHIGERVEKLFSTLELPYGVSLSREGENRYLSDSFGRMLKAILLGVLLLFFSMVPTFRSFSAPLAVISAIPLAIVGGIWWLLVADYHRSLPAMMGLILLSGIIVKNSILLIEFIQSNLGGGAGLKEAILESIRVRTRPVLMTAFATSAGMVPIALAWALGLERLAPLAAVAIGGLLLGTFLTLIYVPTTLLYPCKEARV